MVCFTIYPCLLYLLRNFTFSRNKINEIQLTDLGFDVVWSNFLTDGWTDGRMKDIQQPLKLTLNTSCRWARELTWRKIYKTVKTMKIRWNDFEKEANENVDVWTATTNESHHEISNNVVCEASKGWDKPAHMRSLARAFGSRLNILCLWGYWPNII